MNESNAVQIQEPFDARPPLIVPIVGRVVLYQKTGAAEP